MVSSVEEERVQIIQRNESGFWNKLVFEAVLFFSWYFPTDNIKICISPNE